MNFTLRIQTYLLTLWAAGWFVFRKNGIELPLVPYLSIAAATAVVVQVIIYRSIMKPLRRFVEISDNIADGDFDQNLEKIEFAAVQDVHQGMSKIVSTLVESRGAIENYMQTISSMNKELAQKVDSLSVLYSASRSMGTTLSIDSLIRTLLTLFMERIGTTGAAIMLYNDRTDMITIKDLLGFPPELFAKFRFYSDNKIATNVLTEDECWSPAETDLTLMATEFETDAVRSIRSMFPMRIKDHFVGIVVLGEKKDGGTYSDADRQLIQAVVGLACTSINNATLYEKSEATKNELDRKVFNLMALQQAGKVLSSTLNLEELIKSSIDMFLETVWANKGVLMLSAEDRPDLEVKAFKGISSEEVDGLAKDPAESWAMTTLEKEKKPILSHELTKASNFQSYLAVNRSLPFSVYIPLLKEGEIYGVMKIGQKINGESFTENDLEFFTTLASQAVIAYENARLYSLAITDSITKLYVHRYFQLRLDEEVKRSRRYNSTLSLLLCDIDHFKMINDQYGHQQGDIILREVSMILRRNIRSTDIAARYGGEEFVIILPETTQSDARIVAERIRRDTAKFDFPALAPGQPPLHCTISIGVAGFPLNADSKDELIQKADSSMYQAKDQGRNRVVLCGTEL
ncbi:MAG: Response regulator PleD [bacterium ADurb.Bin374]|nr:MAG: Response regulator PleD [bacterium ADurb.Bin374]